MYSTSAQRCLVKGTRVDIWVCLQRMGCVDSRLSYLQSVRTSSLTLGTHAQRGLLLSVCVSVCYSQSHFSNVHSSHKGYDLLNGQ